MLPWAFFARFGGCFHSNYGIYRGPGRRISGFALATPCPGTLLTAILSSFSLSLSFSLCPSSKLSTRIALVTCSCQVLVLSIVEMGAAQSSFLSNARNDILFSAFLQDATWYSNLEETQDDPFLAGHHRIPIISHYVANILLNILNFQAMKTTTSRNFKGQESSVS
jgi:hypothetical protein